jgi:hypothetical protein
MLSKYDAMVVIMNGAKKIIIINNQKAGKD